MPGKMAQSLWGVFYLPLRPVSPVSVLELQMHAAACGFSWVLGTQTPILMNCTLSKEPSVQPKGDFLKVYT